MKVVHIPNRVWVGAYEFPVKIIPAKHAALDDGGAHGCTFFDSDYGFGIPRAILLADNLDTRHRLEIFIHEITHAINFAHAVANDKGLQVKDDEELCEKHGLAWSQFFLDNPRFVRWMVYTLERLHTAQRRGETEAADNQTDGA